MQSVSFLFDRINIDYKNKGQHSLRPYEGPETILFILYIVSNLLAQVYKTVLQGRNESGPMLGSDGASSFSLRRSYLYEFHQWLTCW